MLYDRRFYQNLRHNIQWHLSNTPSSGNVGTAAETPRNGPCTAPRANQGQHRAFVPARVF
jgi:hypothetical protein